VNVTTIADPKVGGIGAGAPGVITIGSPGQTFRIAALQFVFDNGGLQTNCNVAIKSGGNTLSLSSAVPLPAGLQVNAVFAHGLSPSTTVATTADEAVMNPLPTFHYKDSVEITITDLAATAELRDVKAWWYPVDEMRVLR